MKYTKKIILFLAATILCFIFAAGCQQDSPGEFPAAQAETAEDHPSEELGGSTWSDVVNATTSGKFPLGDLYTGDDGYNVLEYWMYPHISSIQPCATLQAALAKELLEISDDSIDSFIDIGEKNYILEQFVYQYPIGNAGLLDEEFNLVYMEPTPYNLLFTTPLTEAERSYIQSEGGEFLDSAIAADALVFYVSHENPVDSLTLEQARDIYAGKITNWSEVGGDDLKIIAYQDYDTVELLEMLVMDGEPLMEPPYDTQVIPSGIEGGDSYEIETVAFYEDAPESLGLGVLSYMQYQDDVKILTVDGATPQIESLGEYPLSFPYYAVFYEDDQISNTFVGWLTSEEGGNVVTGYGYALPEDLK